MLLVQSGNGGRRSGIRCCVVGALLSCGEMVRGGVVAQADQIVDVSNHSDIMK